MMNILYMPHKSFIHELKYVADNGIDGMDNASIWIVTARRYIPNYEVDDELLSVGEIILTEGETSIVVRKTYNLGVPIGLGVKEIAAISSVTRESLGRSKVEFVIKDCSLGTQELRGGLPDLLYLLGNNIEYLDNYDKILSECIGRMACSNKYAVQVRGNEYE